MKRNDAEMVNDEARNERNERERLTSQGVKKEREPVSIFRSARAYRQRGVALVWTALFLLALVGIVGLSLDYAKVFYNVHELQNAADAAALAGAARVKYAHSGAISDAYDLAYANDAEKLAVTLRTSAQPDPFTPDPETLAYDSAENLFDNYDILVGRWIQQWASLSPGLAGHFPFYPTSALDADAVWVVARREGLAAEAPRATLIFGPIFGQRTTGMRRRAIAWGFSPADYGGGALYCLSKTAAPGFKVWGNANVDVLHGNIQVNSGIRTAAQVGGSATIDCRELNVVGGTSPPPDGTQWDRYMTRPFSVNTDVAVLPDPLKTIMGFDYLAVPPKDSGGNILWGTMRDSKGKLSTPQMSTVSGSCTLGPGYYGGGINMKGNPTITLDPTLGWSPSKGPPIYYLGGVGLVANNGTLTGHGVTVYITNDKNAALNLHGNITIDLSSPADQAGTDPNGLPGIGIWQDSRNTNGVTMQGCSGARIEGTWYFPSAFMDCHGTPGAGARQIIVDSMAVTGDVGVLATYDGRNSPGKTYRAVLVK